MRDADKARWSRLSSALHDMEVPWDDVRSARVHRRALEAFRQGAGEQKTEGRAVVVRRAIARSFHWLGPRGARGARWLLAAAAVMLLVAVSLSGFGVRDEAVPALSGPVLSGWGAPSSLAFADGSRSLLSEQAMVQVLEDAAEHVSVRQSAGRVRYEVAPRHDRRFMVTARDVTVTVVGTIFDVIVDGAKVMVSVERGRVRVTHGAREVVLGPGEKVEIDSVSEGVAPARTEAASEKAAPQASTGQAPSTTAAELLRRADQARAAGRFDEAIAALHRLIKDHPRDRRVMHALFSIGQIERQRGRHQAAAEAFERCGSALQGDAIAEAAGSWSAAGRADRARAAAQRYLAAFPEGVHAERMRALAGSR